jgi:hypothetical protein
MESEMSVLKLLLNSAEADLRTCLWWAERTRDPAWQRQAADARVQCESFRLALGRAPVDA